MRLTDQGNLWFLRASRVLVELNRGIITMLGFHFSATTDPDDVEEGVRLAMITCKDFFQRSGDIKNIPEEERPFKSTAIALLQEKNSRV